MTVDHSVAADTLREDISCGEKLVTVHSDDVRAVLDELARLQAIQQRAARARVLDNIPPASREG